MDISFGKRLNAACDGDPNVPPYGQGRQTWIKEKMGVSNEAVRKWFKGEARPKPAKMAALAELLGVDEAWLSLGIKPDKTPVEKRRSSAMASGAVNIVAGYIQVNGGNIAFPADDDPNLEYVDLYAIISGQQYVIHVAMADETEPEHFKFYVPTELNICRVMGVVVVSPVNVHILNLKPQLLDKHKQRRGGYYELEMRREGDMYFSEDDQWPRVLSFQGNM